MTKYRLHRILSIPALVAGILVSCTNNMEEVKHVVRQEDAPDETSKNVKITYTDFGKPKLVLEAPILHRYILEEASKEGAAKLVCPEGMKLTFYDTTGGVQSQLTSNHGTLNSEQSFMRVTKDVVFKNYKNEQLNTELLDIYFEQDSIYTDSLVKISTERTILTGTGLVSNGNFTKYRINNITNSEFIFD